MKELVTSEFLWGVIVGLLLTVPVAGFSSWLETRKRRRIVVDFCGDTVRYVCDIFQSLEDNNNRNNRIDEELIGLAVAEVSVWGRNREGLVAIADEALRRDIRDFFTRVGSLVVQINGNLNTFQQQSGLANMTGVVFSPGSPNPAQVAQAALNRAASLFTTLIAMKSQRSDLEARLSRARPGFP